MTSSYRFTAKLNRPQGPRIFKGTMEQAPDLASAAFVVRELLIRENAFEDTITSLKITISPVHRKTKASNGQKAHS